MKHLSCTLFALFLLKNLAFGQGWTYTHSDPVCWEQDFRMMETDDGNIWFSGYHKAPGQGVKNNILFSKSGAVLSHFNIKDSLRQTAVLRRANGNYLIAGQKGAFPTDNSVLFGPPILMEVSPSFQVLWVKNLPTIIGAPTRMHETSDGGFWAGGGARLARFDAQGNVLVQKTFGSVLFDRTVDDGFIYIRRNEVWPNYTPLVTRFDKQGDTVWSKLYTNIPWDNGQYQPILRLPTAGFVFLSSYFVNIIDEDGNLTKSENMYLKYRVVPKRVLPTADGGFLMAVYGEVGGYFNGRCLLKLDKNLDFEWYKPNLPHVYFSDLAQLSDGHFLIAGDAYPNQEQPLISYTDSAGTFSNGLFRAKTFIDYDLDCTENAGEKPFSGSICEVWRLPGSFYSYASTNFLGELEVPIYENGDYKAIFHTPNNLWGSCTDTTFFSVDSSQVVERSVGIQPEVFCPALSVQVSTAFLRNCSKSNYSILVCNNGTVATEPLVTVQFGDTLKLRYFGAIPAPISATAQEAVFQLDSLEAGQCTSFWVTAQVGCDTALLGQTLCMTVFVTPDSICNPDPNWSGASITVSAGCENDTTAIFTIENIGTAPSEQGLEYIIIEDQVVLMKNVFSLDPGKKMVVESPADGTYLRIKAEQEPFHPFQPAPVSAFLENCGSVGGSPLINQFPLGDDSPTVERDCHEVVGAYDPNDKQAFPKGFGPSHFIEPNERVSYLIRFQNTGTDTAFRVELRDTIDPALDLLHLRPGASSHPYSWEITGNRILKVLFSPIALPDSGANQAASNGFFQFEIPQKLNVAPNTALKNRAGIYFDFNPAVMTNTVKHIIKPNFITIASHADGPLPPQVAQPLTAMPNPAADFVEIRLENAPPGPKQCFVIDENGRIVQQVGFDGDKVLITGLRKLPDGAYLFEIRQQGRTFGAQRVLIIGN